MGGPILIPTPTPTCTKPCVIVSDKIHIVTVACLRIDTGGGGEGARKDNVNFLPTHMQVINFIDCKLRNCATFVLLTLSISYLNSTQLCT